MNNGNNSKSRLRILFLCVLAIGIIVSVPLVFSPDESASGEKDMSGFNFCLNFNTYGRDQIDTYDGTFTKDLVLDGTMKIEFTLTDDVKKDIYEFMDEINIMSFPDKLAVQGMAVTPYCDYKLTVTMKGRTKTIVWNEGFFVSMNHDLPKENSDFLKLVEKIGNYVYNTDAYKSMPKANGGYD